jgi:hypothetical protein
MEGYDSFVHRANEIIPGVALAVGIVLDVRAPGRLNAVSGGRLWRHRQRMPVVGDVVERLEAHAGSAIPAM